MAISSQIKQNILREYLKTAKGREVLLKSFEEHGALMKREDFLLITEGLNEEHVNEFVSKAYGPETFEHADDVSLPWE